MNNVSLKLASIIAVSLVSLAACTAPNEADENAPSADEDGLETAASITSVNASGTWVATALGPTYTGSPGNFQTVSRATFTGPATTRRMGVCLLQRRHAVACNTATDCANAGFPFEGLPAGGFRYCTNVDGVGQKYCFYRGGPASTHCAGTPAHGAPIAPGTYASPSATLNYGTTAISYACFEGCTVTDPSVSSSTITPIYQGGPRG
jgi:hypothetical protein